MVEMPQGGADVGLDVGVVGLAGDLFDDAAEDAVAEVRVGPVGAGLVGEWMVGDGFGDELCVVPAVVVHHGGRCVVGPAAAGVGEEFVDGDVGDPLFVGGLAVFVVEDGAGAEDFVGEVELALLDEGEDGDGGDGLGDGGDAEEGVLLGLTRCWRSAMPTVRRRRTGRCGRWRWRWRERRIVGERPRRCGPSRRAPGRWSRRTEVGRGL